MHTIKYSQIKINFTEDFHKFKKSTDVKNFYDNVILNTSNIYNAKLMIEVIDIKAVNAALIMMTAIVNTAIIFLNYNDLCFNKVLKIFMIRLYILSFI